MPSVHIPLWKQAPFLQLLFPLVAGIVVGWAVSLFPVFHPLPALGIFLAVVVFLHILLYFLGGRLRKYAGIEIALILFLFGCLLSWWNNESLRPHFAGRFLTDSSLVKVRLEEPLAEKAHSWGTEARVLSVVNGAKMQNVCGHVLLYFQKGKQKPDLRYGDVLLIPNRLEKIKNSGNPGAFDYNRYCRTKNIAFSAYLPRGKWLVLKQRKGNTLKAFFLQCRAACLNVLEKYIPRPQEAGVAEALLLGYRENLDPALVQAYANVGVIHLIAISGLHIGLIYLVLVWLFRFLPEKKGLKTLKGILICLSLWSFTLLTGAHPSTLRATIMLSFLVAGTFFFRREANTFNSLAASAFLLLCINPFLLFDVGFQLSYLAVAGILIFQRPIDDLLWFRHKAGNYIWKMISVSLAAQLLTFPLVLYYFHQFPSFFLISNLLLIPAATFALYGEIILLAFSFIPAIAKVTGIALTKLLVFMNGSILWAGHFQFIRLQHVGLHPLELWLTYGCIILIAAWLIYKNKKMLIAAFATAAIFSLFSLMRRWEGYTQKKVIVYQIAGHSAIEWVKGQQSRFIGDTAVWTDPDTRKYTLVPAKEKLNLTSRIVVQTNKSFFRFFDKKIAIIRQSFHPDSLKGVFPLDYVILSGYNHLKMEEIKRRFSPVSVVLDASVASWQRQKWKTACKQLNLHCFSVPDQGAWILSLK